MSVARHLLLGMTALLGAITGHAPDAYAASFNATPATAQAVLAKAGPGDTVILAPGEYPTLLIRGRRFQPALTIDARKATLQAWLLRDVEGVTFNGGVYRLPKPFSNPRTGALAYGQALRMDDVKNIRVIAGSFVGPATGAAPGVFGEGIAVAAIRGEDIEIAASTFEGFKVGVALTRIRGFRVINNKFRRMRADGMQAGESRAGLIEGNHCAGTQIRSDEHPDCIQLWSRPPSPPSDDITIRRNKIEGHTQGIGMFNHVRGGVDDGGFDRVLIEDNDIEVGFGHAIYLMSGRASIVRNNRVRTVEGAPYRASINIGPGVTRCGNVVAAGAGRLGVVDKAC